MNQQLWEAFLPHVPYPKGGVNYAEFCAVRDLFWREENIEFENQALVELHALQGALGFFSFEERQQLSDGYDFLIKLVSDRLTGLLANV